MQNYYYRRSQSENRIRDRRLVIYLCKLHDIGSVTSAWTETFGACNYTSFVAQAVGICEKRFYTDLANDLQADCR